MRTLTVVAVIGLALGGTACAAGGGGSGSDPNRLTAEQIGSVGVSNLYEAVQRLRPRWLDVRSQRTFTGETVILVILNRTVLGVQDELRSLGVDIADSMEYMPGARAAGEFALPGNVHVEGVIIVRTSGER